MATLFFEGFNLSNSDGSPYLDSRYWSRPFSQNPVLTYNTYSYNDTSSVDSVNVNGTQGSLNISGYRLGTTPAQFATPLQLSGLPDLNSDQLYLSFRIKHLSFNDTISPAPHTAKLLAFCNGNTEVLSVDVIKTIGPSIQGGSWTDGSSDFSENGIGLSIKQAGIEIGLFDLRIENINSYKLLSPSTPNLSTQIVASDGLPRFIHLEFLLNKQNNSVSLMLEGIDVLNRLSGPPYEPTASTTPIGSINNIKFYNKGFSNEAFINNDTIARFTIDDFVVWNSVGNAPNNWMGPKTRIFHMKDEESSFILDGWKKEPSSFLSNNMLSSKDGDNSYIYTDNSGDITSFRIKNSQILNSDKYNTYIFDGIGGIRLFNEARKIFLDSDFVNVYTTAGDGLNLVDYAHIGSEYTVNKRSYGIYNSFIFENPATSEPWNSGNLFEQDTSLNYRVIGYWGIKKL